MRGLPLRFVSSLLTLALAAPRPAISADKPPQMDEAKRAAHVLNRLAFGPRPREIERVRSTGIDKWIDQQLHPEKLDDSALQARLAAFRTLNMSSKELVENFPPPQVLKAIADGRMKMPSDPAKRAIYESQLEAYKTRQERKADSKTSQTDEAVNGFFDDMERGARRREAKTRSAELQKLSPDERFAAILKMSPEDRRFIAQSLAPEEREELLQGFSAEQREQLQTMARAQQVVVNELASAKILRTVYSERQLEEVITDFWFNHFNVFINKGADRYLASSYERDAIRKHALGKFEDLLLATATHPAMLFYLDNFQSVGPNSRAGLGFRRNGNRRFTLRAPSRPKQQQQKRGLNENYARELMELHTLGVDGGYTQRDVTEVAKVFTGWTIREPRRGGDFEFRPQLHEPGNKQVLGKTIHESGEHEGREVLHILATHPSTAKFISKKLAMRFVSDDPPQTLVNRMATTFSKTHGDIREVLRTMLKSPEFWAPDAYRAKVKTPFEFVVSALRSTGAEVSDGQQLVQILNRMGMPLYGMQPPTGYSMKAEAWVNSSALIDRMNFSLALASGKVRGVSLDPQRLADEAASRSLDSLTRTLLAGDISQQTREIVEKQIGQSSTSPAVVKGLLMGSPEFQRR